jgi:hypothetical protein
VGLIRDQLHVLAGQGEQKTQAKIIRKLQELYIAKFPDKKPPVKGNHDLREMANDALANACQQYIKAPASSLGFSMTVRFSPATSTDRRKSHTGLNSLAIVILEYQRLPAETLQNRCSRNARVTGA